MHITFRDATPADRPILIKLLSDLQWVEKRLYPDRQDPSFFANRYVDEFLSDQKNNKGAVFVAIDKDAEDKIVGYSWAFPDNEYVNTRHTLYVEDLIIVKGYRSHGIGKQFLDFISEYAKGKGFAKIGLGVLTKNVKARKFYKRYGFTPFAVELEKGL